MRVSRRYRKVRKNLRSSDGSGTSVPSKSKNAATPPLPSFTSLTSFTSCTSPGPFTPPPALHCSLLVPAPHFLQCISTLPPTPAILALGKTPPSSTSKRSPPRGSWRGHPLPVDPHALPAHVSAPTPVPSNKSSSTSSRHTNLCSSATPPAPAPTTSAAWRSRPNRSVPPSSPVRAENLSPPRAQKTKPAATVTPSQRPQNT